MVVIKTSKVKEASGDFRVSSEFYEALDKVINEKIKEAKRRADENGRVTLMPYDLSPLSGERAESLVRPAAEEAYSAVRMPPVERIEPPSLIRAGFEEFPNQARSEIRDLCEEEGMAIERGVLSDVESLTAELIDAIEEELQSILLERVSRSSENPGTLLSELSGELAQSLAEETRSSASKDGRDYIRTGDFLYALTHAFDGQGLTT